MARQATADDLGRRIARHDGVTPRFILEHVTDLNRVRFVSRKPFRGFGERHGPVDLRRLQLHVLHIRARCEISKQLHHLIRRPFSLKDFGKRFAVLTMFQTPFFRCHGVGNPGREKAGISRIAFSGAGQTKRHTPQPVQVSSSIVGLPSVTAIARSTGHRSLHTVQVV